MKRSSPLMKILPIAVLAAVLLYFAVQLYNYLSDPVSTTLVTEGQAEDTIALNGWLLRGSGWWGSRCTDAAPPMAPPPAAAAG